MTKKPNRSQESLKKRRAYVSEWSKKNREKLREYHRKRYKEKGDEIRAYKREWRSEPHAKRSEYAQHLRAKFSISIGWYDQQIQKQSGRCGICQEPAKESRALAVDHNHETGEIRGLLCTSCNTALGVIENAGIEHFIAWIKNGGMR